MSTLRISDAPLLPDVNGTEKIPTGGRGDYAISVDQIKDHIFQDVGKELVGLGNVDNTSDLDKPVSTAQQAALDLKADKTYVDANLDLKADKTNVYTRSETTLALSTKADLVGGVIPSNQLPSYVDDVVEYTTSTLPIIGESGKIYITTDTNRTWRWSGNQYVEISNGGVSDSTLKLQTSRKIANVDFDGTQNIDIPHNNLTGRNIENSHTAASIGTANGENQQDINDYNGAKWRNKAGGYAIGDDVKLDSGDIVRSTVANNAVNPNTDMTGWVKEPNANSIFRVNGKFVGMVPFFDISSALSGFLNSSDVQEIYLDGEYLLNSQIIVSSNATPKKIFCSDSTILKPMVAGNLPLFDLYSSVEFHGTTFDYQNGNCFTTLRYRPNCGLVKLRDIKVKNIKDMVSSYGTIIFSISAEGNKLDIDDISFENCLKLGNGNITDSAGSLNGVYYFGTTGMVRGEIKNIYAKDYHNINASSQIIIEDTTVVYLATGGAYTPLTVENVIGDEFGKRLVKAQCSGTTFKNIRGTSTTGDSLSVLGILSEVGQFTANNNIVSGVYARGNMDYGYADSGVNTQADNLDIDLYGSNALNDGNLHFGAYLASQAKKNTISKSIIKARRPIGINPTLVGEPIEDLNFDDVDLELTDQGNVFIDIPGNASITNGAIKRLTAKMTLRTSATRTTGAQLISTFAAQKNYSDFDLDVKFVDKSSASNAAKSILGGFNYIKNLTLKAKFISEGGLAPDQVGDLATISNSSNVFVHVESEQKFNRGIIATANNGFKVSKDFKLGLCAIGQIVATGAGTKYEVPDHVTLFNGLTSVNEVLRGFGSTAQRPANATIGFPYFDTTLGKVVNLKSANPNVWVDATGATV